MSDPSVCPTCQGAMKPLFTGFYCPRDCDKPQVAVGYKKLVAQVKAAMATPGPAYGGWWNLPQGYPIPAAVPVPSPLPDDLCRKPYCGSKGSRYITVIDPDPLQCHEGYQCNLCGYTWQIYQTPQPVVN